MDDESIEALGGYSLIKVGNYRHGLLAAMKQVSPNPIFVPSILAPGKITKYTVVERAGEHHYFMIV